MSKLTFTFNLPKQRVEFELAYHGADYHSVLWDLDQQLRNWLKYGHEFTEAGAALEAVREKLHGLMDAEGVVFQE
uniref:Uncharacterized protein n=1 Tax=viral metagenome TaxID=1070528 RepID=A0A6M3JIB5_9ZZZZ